MESRGDYGFERGEYGRYENVDSIISGYGVSPIGTGTFITDNWYDPGESQGTTFMLNPEVINANEATYHFNWQIQSGGYKRYNANEVTDKKIRYYTYWYQSTKANDYNLITHNCTTTTIDSIMFGWEHRSGWNQAANDTLWLLKYEFNPSTVAAILYNDYEKHEGRGLVSYIINSKK